MTPRTKHMLAGGALGALGVTLIYGIFHRKDLPFLPSGEHRHKHEHEHEENDRGEYGHEKKHHHKGHHGE